MHMSNIPMHMSLVSIYYVDSIDRVNKVLPTSLPTLLLTLLLNITNVLLLQHLNEVPHKSSTNNYLDTPNFSLA